MLVKLNQQDGHVRTYEIRTISNDAAAAIAVADGMRNGERAEVSVHLPCLDFLQVRLPSSSIDKFIIMENCECLVSENGNVSKIS